MTLSEKDGQLFYQLWFPLLDYVNQRCKVNKRLKKIAGAQRLNPEDVKEVADKLWDNAELIDEYLDKIRDDLPEEHKQIVSSWKNCVQGSFIVERHLKRGSILISEEEKVYQVQGIISSLEEMFRGVRLPLLMKATLIPFRDVIITDGLMMPYNLMIGGNMKRQFKEVYMNAKKNGRVIKNMEEEREEDMQNKTWEKFGRLVDKCYSNMVRLKKDGGCWEKAYELLKEIVLEERRMNPDFAPELEMLDDATEYEYDIQGWLEDCLDEIEMREENEVLLAMCDDLLEMFEWPEYTGSDLKFRKTMALSALGRKKDSVQYCVEWIEKEPENIVAAVAGVYAFIKTNEFDSAEKLVDHFIVDKSECTDDNAIMFTAASGLYEAMGKKKEKRQIDKAIKKYEEYSEKYFENMEFDDEEDWDFWDDDLPFN